MIVEVVRLLDRWLKHETFGLEAMLRQIPRETPEGTTDPLPETPCIVNDTEDPNVAKDLEPAQVPAVVLYGTNGPKVALDASGRTRQIIPSVIVAAAYITRDAEPLKAGQDGGYVLRAIKKSFSAYNPLANARGYRTLNGFTIAKINEVTEHQVRGAVGRSQLWGFQLATIVVIDSDP
jgi:hypothetical protein